MNVISESCFLIYTKLWIDPFYSNFTYLAMLATDFSMLVLLSLIKNNILKGSETEVLWNSTP
jgi:hypothetical protein